MTMKRLCINTYSVHTQAVYKHCLLPICAEPWASLGQVDCSWGVSVFLDSDVSPIPKCHRFWLQYDIFFGAAIFLSMFFYTIFYKANSLWFHMNLIHLISLLLFLMKIKWFLLNYSIILYILLIIRKWGGLPHPVFQLDIAKLVVK